MRNPTLKAVRDEHTPPPPPPSSQHSAASPLLYAMMLPGCDSFSAILLVFLCSCGRFLLTYRAYMSPVLGWVCHSTMAPSPPHRLTKTPKRLLTAHSCRLPTVAILS
ncbi:hypothetical protein E2C01_071907 [Portunus trituberculatus]|uniref:Uncharacterized protein n=1 Tax=Portunus trituberculatus TaxID=210409 RepID=A0A5B7I547_PORTR|nr:hypothetical protein [Portunus trituberculatus]